jgi:lipoprotein-anchoring transpeptidase ErfK/SrfK
MIMSRLKNALAAGALALATIAVPAHATDETPEARLAATAAAQTALEDMRATFGNTSLATGKFLWRTSPGSNEVTRVVISLADQMAYAYSGNELVGVSTISSGNASKPTPPGIFPILDKKRLHRSIKYDNAPMPYMQRLDQWGIALHAGHLPGHPASHGCVRLPAAFAAKLFAATRIGTVVLIAPDGTEATEGTSTFDDAFNDLSTVAQREGEAGEMDERDQNLAAVTNASW